MRSTYRVLAYLVAAEVAIQAAAIAYALFGLGKWIDNGGVLDKTTMESTDASFTGVLGFAVHGINGQMVIPLIALLLLVTSFFAKVRHGVLWAAIVVAVVAVQVTLGLLSHAVVGLGALHGLNALVLFVVAIAAARRADVVVTPAPDRVRERVA